MFMVSRETNRKLVILDRDGVINEETGCYVKTENEWRAIPGSLEAIAALHQNGWLITVATNQSGIARGLYDEATLWHIHQRMFKEVEKAGGKIDHLEYCPDSDNDNPMRKPNPGMLLEIGRKLKVDLRGCPLIGDSLRDLQAAWAVGAAPILVRTGNGELTWQECNKNQTLVPTFDNLHAAARWLIRS